MVELDMTDKTLEAALQLIQHGTPNVALAAAKSLGFNAASSMPGPGCLEPDGTIRAMMKVFDTPNLSLEDITDLYESVETLLGARPRLIAQVVAACADPDPRIAFAALVQTRRLLADLRTSRAMLKAGAVPAVLSALKHSNACCRAAAASVAAARVFDIGLNAARRTRMFGVPRSALKRLLEAGLVPALMDITRAGCSHDAPPASPGVFSNIQVEMATESHIMLLPNFQPALHACNTLQLLARPDVSGATEGALGGLSQSETQQVVEEVVKVPQAAAVIVQCLQHCARELQEAPACLVSAVLSTMSEQGGRWQAKRTKTFCTQLLGAGLPDILPSLIRPEEHGPTGYMLLNLLKIFQVLGFNCLPADSLPALAAACAKCIEEGGGGVHQRDIRTAATGCLDCISKALRRGVSRRVPRSQLCIEASAGITDERGVKSSSRGEGPQLQRDPGTSGKKQQTACIQCGKLEGDGVRLRPCSRCMTAMYCGQACQRSHWPHHKAECKRWRAAVQNPS